MKISREVIKNIIIAILVSQAAYLGMWVVLRIKMSDMVRSSNKAHSPDSIKAKDSLYQELLKQPK